MVKPRGKVTRSKKPSPGFVKISEPQEITIAAWSPRDDGQNPTQVHFIFHVPDLLGHVPLVIRFKSPDSLGFFIEELARYRREVWLEAEEVETVDSGGYPALRRAEIGEIATLEAEVRDLRRILSVLVQKIEEAADARVYNAELEFDVSSEIEEARVILSKAGPL